MKNILFIILLLFITISCKAQIIAVEKFEDYPYELPDGAHIKDINKVLDKYVGKWKGTYNNKNYELRIIKVTINNIKLKYKHDKLLIRYKITDSSGKELVNTLNLPDNNKYVIKGNYLTKYGGYVLSYIGFNSKCGQNGSVFISVKNNKMRLGLHVRGEINPEKCKNRAVEQILPTKGGMELVKK